MQARTLCSGRIVDLFGPTLVILKLPNVYFADVLHKTCSLKLSLFSEGCRAFVCLFVFNLYFIHGKDLCFGTGEPSVSVPNAPD